MGGRAFIRGAQGFILCLIKVGRALYYVLLWVGRALLAPGL